MLVVNDIIQYWCLMYVVSSKVPLVQRNYFVQNVFQFKLMTLSWERNVAKSLSSGSVWVRISSNGISHVDCFVKFVRVLRTFGIIFRMRLDVEEFSRVGVGGEFMYTS